MSKNDGLYAKSSKQLQEEWNQKVFEIGLKRMTQIIAAVEQDEAEDKAVLINKAYQAVLRREQEAADKKRLDEERKRIASENAKEAAPEETKSEANNQAV